MTKKEKLERLDELVLDRMVKLVENGDTNELAELSVAVNYLKSNAVVEEKSRSSVEEDTKARLAEADERRKKKALST